MTQDLPFTGERFVPGTRGEIWVEHWHRYHFAARWVGGRRVLDVACGEGYGAALLARSAAHVTAADLSPEAIEHARRRYAALGNAAFVCAPCTRLPLADASIDVAVSFETIEHIAEQDEFLAELARVLTPTGVLILSCPNKLEYSDKRAYSNEFHVRELYRDGLDRLLAPRFPECRWYGQRATFFSVIAPEAPQPVQGQLVEVDESHPADASSHLANPLYFLVVASRQGTALDAPPPTLSVLADRGDWVYRDYGNAMREMERAAARGHALEGQVAERERSIAGLQGAVRASQRVQADLVAGLAQRDATLAERDAALAACDAALAEQAHEIMRRRGWRWWLRLPLVRLGLLGERGPRHP